MLTIRLILAKAQNFNPLTLPSTVAVLHVGFAMALFHALSILVIGLNQPLLDMYSFRQTQTALSAYWMLHGGPLLAYETPVAGAPWSIPFEFPFYQWITAILATLGIPLNAAGRIVSFGFFVAALWPIKMLVHTLQLGRMTYLAIAILYLFAPIYVYWARTFMIETCAVFFGLLWLAYVARYVERLDKASAVGACIAGCLAVLTKSTTFPAFALLGATYVMWTLLLRFNRIHSERLLIVVAQVAGFIAIPFIIGFAWVGYSDAVKLENEFGSLLTSTQLAKWNFGTISQRLGDALWINTILNRALPEALGCFGLVALVAVVATVGSKRHRLAALSCIIGFLVPFLLFTNLHIVHNYYQAANAVFLLAAIGIGIGALMKAGYHGLAILGLIAIVGGQLFYFHTRFISFVTNDYSSEQSFLVSEIAKNSTRQTQSLLIFGYDWSSVIPYHAERKGYALAPWTPTPLISRILANPQRFLGTSSLGGIVYCTDKLKAYGNSAQSIENFISGRFVLGEVGMCRVVSPTRKIP